MKTVLILLGCGLSVIRPPVMGEDAPVAALEQRAQSFTVTLNASVAEVTPLFGPMHEAEWAPSWKPHFLHPVEGAQRDGVIFTTVTRDGRERLWLLTTYDLKQGRVEYVFVTPGLTANAIKIQVAPNGEKRCRATITYRHSALTPEGNEEVQRLNAQWAEQQRVHWETAVNAALAKGGAP